MDGVEVKVDSPGESERHVQNDSINYAAYYKAFFLQMERYHYNHQNQFYDECE